MLGPSIGHLECRDQMLDSINTVSEAIDGFLRVTEAATNDPNLLDSLKDAASRVKDALGDLMNQVHQVSNCFFLFCLQL